MILQQSTRTKTSSLFIVLLTLCLFISAGCSKDGEDGKDGTNGTNGADGTDGTQGPAGTANVIYSPWMSSTIAKDTIVDNSNMRVVYLAAPKITDEIVTKGVVHVYFSFGSGIYPLPYISYAGGKSSTISFAIKIGGIAVLRFTHDNTASANLPSTLQYRYVIVPGGAAARGNATLVNWADYESVKAYLGLTD